MIADVISSLINKNIVSIYKNFSKKDMLIYLDTTNELFSTLKYDGYLRNTSTSFIDKEGFPSGLFTRNIYKLVIFFDGITCEKEIMNVISNLTLPKQVDTVVSINPTNVYRDSWDNIKKELNKDDAYLKYRVIVIDIETEEKICKTKIKCND